jgi:N-acetylglucosamine kinase-like BadF-type ATPase
MAAACAYFHVTTPDDLSTAIYSPTMTNERLAGFSKQVIEAAKSKDPVAREIIAEAGSELGLAVAAVIRNLKLEPERFQVAYVGGVFAAGGDLVLGAMSERILQIAPLAYVAPPRMSPSLAAARIARERSNLLALAG